MVSTIQAARSSPEGGQNPKVRSLSGAQRRGLLRMANERRSHGILVFVCVALAFHCGCSKRVDQAERLCAVCVPLEQGKNRCILVADSVRVHEMLGLLDTSKSVLGTSFSSDWRIFFAKFGKTVRRYDLNKTDEDPRLYARFVGLTKNGSEERVYSLRCSRGLHDRLGNWRECRSGLFIVDSWDGKYPKIHFSYDEIDTLPFSLEHGKPDYRVRHFWGKLEPKALANIRSYLRYVYPSCIGLSWSCAPFSVEELPAGPIVRLTGTVTAVFPPVLASEDIFSNHLRSLAKDVSFEAGTDTLVVGYVTAETSESKIDAIFRKMPGYYGILKP